VVDDLMAGSSPDGHGAQGATGSPSTLDRITSAVVEHGTQAVVEAVGSLDARRVWRGVAWTALGTAAVTVALAALSVITFASVALALAKRAGTLSLSWVVAAGLVGVATAALMALPVAAHIRRVVAS
jgi:hypothetical protein